MFDVNENWNKYGIIDSSDLTSQIYPFNEYEDNLNLSTKSKATSSNINDDNVSDSDDDHDFVENTNVTKTKRQSHSIKGEHYKSIKSDNINLEDTLHGIINAMNEMKENMNNINDKIELIKTYEDEQINSLKIELNKIKLICLNHRNHDNNSKQRNGDKNDDIISISNWLTNNVKLPEYINNFLINGYDSFDVIFEIKHKKELKEIGIKLKGHQLKILNKICELRKKRKKQKQKIKLTRKLTPMPVPLQPNK